MLTAQERLAEALAARHELMIGKRISLIRRDGKSVEYSGVADIGRLDRYIAELQAEVGGKPMRRGPAGVR